MANIRWTRRQFLAGSAAAGIALTFSRLAFGEESFKAHETMPVAPGWSKGIGQPRYRVDGYAKVTGAKIYARDFRAKDMPGWPSEMSHALMLFADDATHRFTGIDLSILGDDLQPDRIVLAEDLEKAGIKATGIFAGDLLCPKGKTPLYLGQPVAMLIYRDFVEFNTARQRLRGRTGVVKFGNETGPVAGEDYGGNRFTRVAGPSRQGPDKYSPVKDGWVVRLRFQRGGLPGWISATPNAGTEETASEIGAAIRKDLADGKAGRVFKQSFQTQSADPFFMEPESGLAWYDAANAKMSILFGGQSPGEGLNTIAGLYRRANLPVKVGQIDGYFPYLGGAFGGRDRTIVSLYVAIVGLYADGRPVRLALDRFEQFQIGVKRHAIAIESAIGVDPDSGEFQAFICDLTLNGGGLANYSASVADVSAVSSPSMYYFPRSDVTTVANHSRAVTAGSMRCYGAYQSLTAMECLVDDVASQLKMDPISLRRKNALRTGDLTLTGAPPSGDVRTLEVLDAMERADLWAKRADNRKDYESANPSKAYGVGTACLIFKYGTGEDGVLAALSFDAEGKISVTASSVEMGTGTSTAVALRAADYLGRNADDVSMETTGPVWEPLGLVTSGDPYTITQAEQDQAAKNPRWVPEIASRASASVGAHVTTHAVAQAGYVLMRFGLWPAARAIWSEGPMGGREGVEDVTFDDLRWVDGKLTGRVMEPLEFERLASKAHEMGLVTEAMVHAYNRWEWARAEFEIGDETWTGPIDALAIRRAGGEWAVIDRKNVRFPPAIKQRVGATYFSACGAVVALSVDRTNGKVEVLKIHQVLDCGRSLVPDLVSGMSQGAIAMGVGHALYEYLPLYEDGPGSGDWNVNRYHVIRASEVPLQGMTLEMLPRLSDTEPPKGMAEITMIPVVPCILNAIHDAIGHRFTHVPVSADDIAKVL